MARIAGINIPLTKHAEDEFMAANAGRELGRLTKYTGNASSVVKSQLSRIFEQYEMYGRGDAVWLAAADTASYYADSEPCLHTIQK